MKTLLIGLLTLGSVSAMASVECYVNNKAGEHIELSEKSGLVETGAPFGIVSLHKANGRYHLSSIANGEQSIASFAKKLTLTKQKPLGISVGGDASLGNIVCE